MTISRKAGRGVLVAVLTMALSGASYASDPVDAAAPQAAESRAAGNPAPDLDLDQLLQLPDSYAEPGVGGQRVAGANSDEWLSRFVDADAQIDEAKKSLAEAQRLLEAGASDSSQWQIAAPGASPDPEASGAGLSHRQRVRRGREELESAETRRRALAVEADLAGVPEGWRR